MSNDQRNPDGYDYNEPTGYPYPSQSGSYGSYSPYYQGTQYPYMPPSYGSYGGHQYQPMPYTGGATSQYPATGAYPPTPSAATPGVAPQAQGAAPGQTGVEVPGLLPSEQSYIENILRLNLGKLVTIYMTFENNKEWNAKVFQGKLQAAGRDHIIISDPDTDKRYLLPMIYLDYITFEGPINYSYTFE